MRAWTSPGRAPGLITYMRTDSLRLSEEAIAAAKGFIESRYGKEYYPAQARRYKTKGNAQDAHEAIRPSDVTLTPEDVKKDLTSEQYRLYRLIWGRFLACQMASAVYDSVSIEAQSAGYTFRASHSELKFSGFTAVYEEGRDEDDEAPQSPLPDLREGEPLDRKGLKQDQHFTQPPTRYTEATLIKALEEKGIGRPSTYAPTISTILNREYVVKEGKYLRTTPLGEVVTGLMKDKFNDIVDYAFTAQMEERLDKVEEGEANWKKVLSDFYGGFEAELHQAEQDLDGSASRCQTRFRRRSVPSAGGTWSSSPAGSAASWPVPAGRSATSPCRWWWRCRASAPSAEGVCSSARARAKRPTSSTPITAVSTSTARTSPSDATS